MVIFLKFFCILCFKSDCVFVVFYADIRSFVSGWCCCRRGSRCRHCCAHVLLGTVASCCRCRARCRRCCVWAAVCFVVEGVGARGAVGGMRLRVSERRARCCVGWLRLATRGPGQQRRLRWLAAAFRVGRIACELRFQATIVAAVAHSIPILLIVMHH